MYLRIICIIFAAIVVSAFFIKSVAADSAKNNGIFGSREKKSSNLSAFKKWNDVVVRYKGELEAISRKCTKSTPIACNYQRLSEFAKNLSGKPIEEKLRLTNTLINNAKYITDRANWGVKDKWNSPGEFMARFGDCEDHAIAKYVTLILAGVSEDRMRIVAVNDLNLKVGHAILVVFDQKRSFVLDNQISSVVEAKRIKHYAPIYSINSKFWWRHLN